MKFVTAIFLSMISLATMMASEERKHQPTLEAVFAPEVFQTEYLQVASYDKDLFKYKLDLSVPVLRKIQDEEGLERNYPALVKIDGEAYLFDNSVTLYKNSELPKEVSETFYRQEFQNVVHVHILYDAHTGVHLNIWLEEENGEVSQKMSEHFPIYFSENAEILSALHEGDRVDIEYHCLTSVKTFCLKDTDANGDQNEDDWWEEYDEWQSWIKKAAILEKEGRIEDVKELHKKIGDRAMQYYAEEIRVEALSFGLIAGLSYEKAGLRDQAEKAYGYVIQDYLDAHAKEITFLIEGKETFEKYFTLFEKYGISMSLSLEAGFAGTRCQRMDLFAESMEMIVKNSAHLIFFLNAHKAFEEGESLMEHLVVYLDAMIHFSERYLDRESPALQNMYILQNEVHELVPGNFEDSDEVQLIADELASTFFPSKSKSIKNYLKIWRSN